MARRFLLGGIMLVSVAIIMIAVQHQWSSRQRKARTDVPADARGQKFEVRKSDKQNNLVLIITGHSVAQPSDKGPIDVVQPEIRIVKDRDRVTVITADTGRFEGDLGTAGKRKAPAKSDNPERGWLKGHVVMRVIDTVLGDNTLGHCDYLEYHGDTGEVFVPEWVRIENRSMLITGARLVGDRFLAKADLEKNVHVTLKEVREGLLPDMTGDESQPRPARAKTAEPVPVVITCDGKLVYEKEAARATFNRNVRAVQGDTTLTGDTLVALFAKAEKSAAAPEEDASSTGGGMKIRRVIVTAEKKDGVVVEGPDRQGWGNRLEYDGKEGMLVFTGTPCRTSQKSGKSSYQIQGDEIRWGRSRLIGVNEKLPEGMTELSRKALVTGTPENPARTVEMRADSAVPSVLTGSRILFDQDGRVVWLEGDASKPARTEQDRNLIVGREIELFQKTGTRGEKVTAKGPGRVELARKTASPEKPVPEPTLVDFADRMSYLRDENRADFAGSVKLTDQTTTCNSDTLHVELAEVERTDARGKKSTSTDIKKMVAVGRVVATDANRTAVGDRLVYDYPQGMKGPFVATVTGKPGEDGQVKWSDNLMRAHEIVMTQVQRPDRKTAMHITGDGKGYVVYRPMAETENETKRQQETIEVWYEKHGEFDQAAQKAVFDGNARMKRGDMTLTANRAQVDFVERPPKPGQKSAGDQLNVSALTGVGNVTVVSGRPDQLVTATGEKVVWRQDTGKADLYGNPETGRLARIVRDRNTLDAPVMFLSTSKGAIDNVLTQGGGHLVGYTRSKKPAAEGGMSKLDVTWTGEGLYRPIDRKAGARAPDQAPPNATAFAAVSGNAHGVSEDTDVVADRLTVFLAPAPAASGSPPQKGGLQMEQVLATGSACAKLYVPVGKYYRCAKGDLIRWDRVGGKFTASSTESDALVWDTVGNLHWEGKMLMLSRTPDGKVEVESVSSRQLIFYDSTKPKIPASTDNGTKTWEPVY
jgi:lipopolysaccharide export system protein LptA